MDLYWHDIRNSLKEQSILPQDDNNRFTFGRDITPKRKSGVDCRSLQKTSELVAKFETRTGDASNSLDYSDNLLQTSNGLRTPETKRTLNIPRSDSFSLQQRRRLCSPGFSLDDSPLKCELRLKSPINYIESSSEDLQSDKRKSIGLRLECPNAKSRLISGGSVSPKSGFAYNTDQQTSSYPENSFKVVAPRLSPLTILTKPNKQLVKTSVSLTQSKYDSGAETMTSHSDYGSEESTPVPKRTSFNAVHPKPKASQRLFATGGRKSVDSIQDHSEIKSTNSSNSQFIPSYTVKTPTKSRKSLKIVFPFCGSSKSSKVKTDAYCLSPQIPKTPEIDHHKRISLRSSSKSEKLKTSKSQEFEKHTPTYSNVKETSDTSSEHKDLSFSASVPPKKPQRASTIRPINFDEPLVSTPSVDNDLHCQDGSVTPTNRYSDSSGFHQSMGSVTRDRIVSVNKIRSQYANSIIKSLSIQSDDTGSNPEESDVFATTPDASVSSRGASELRRTFIESRRHTIPNTPTPTHSNSNSLSRHYNHSHNHYPPPSSLDPRRNTTLLSAGATIDEETFQRVIEELHDMRGLLAGLARLMSGTGASAQRGNHFSLGGESSPLDEIWREELMRKFAQSMCQDASTQTEADQDAEARKGGGDRSGGVHTD